jgi:hypothetical protein
MTERSWLVPGLCLTLLSGASALVLMPNYSGVLPALGLLPLWLVASAALAAFYAYARMAMARVPSPFRHIAQTVRSDWRGLLMIAVGITVAGLNMIAFMWTKPLLNYYVPFWADPYLANIDRVLFLGHDPWSLLGWLNSYGTALFYHRGWFAMMILTLLLVLCRPASPKKSAVMLTYFVLWSVVGPVIHILLPAAGPVFYDDLGYGSRFAAIQLPDEMVQMSDYLWTIYQGDRFGPGSGISAMPSLHIATTVWIVLAIYVLARRWTVPMAALGLLIFLLSMSLGWHYAVDGIVGAVAAIGCYRLALAYYDGSLARRLKLQAADPSSPQARTATYGAGLD